MGVLNAGEGMTIAVVIAEGDAVIVAAPLSAWHAAGRFTHRPAHPGEDPVLHLSGLLNREEAERLAAYVDEQATIRARKVPSFGDEEAVANRVRAEAMGVWCPDYQIRKPHQDRECNSCMRTSCGFHPLQCGPFRSSLSAAE
jgi:hypothetical protein